MTTMPCVLLSAFGIHNGGGLVLLKALTNRLGSRVKAAALDARVQEEDLLPEHGVHLTYVRRSFIARLHSLFELTFRAESADVLLCFNSLPPLWKTTCRVIVYVHAPHFVNMHRGIRYSLLTAIRIRIERLWFKLGVSRCSEIWVQTATMALAMGVAYPHATVKIVPFVDDDLAGKLAKTLAERLPTSTDGAQFLFFYPADGVGHKNHVNLLKAWSLLHAQGVVPKLRLTLEAEEIDRVAEQAGLSLALMGNIENLGRVCRADVLYNISVSSAMIFPSLAETFGLPMLEARALGVAILASERDFVRDVCIPIETFDPTSPRSIAAAILRFMKHSSVLPVSVLNMDEFSRLLLDEGSGGGDRCQGTTA